MTIDDRKRQVETTRARYGPDHYKGVGAKSSTFKNKDIARLAALKRWHPERFNEAGELIKEEK